jgi:hypothetical protein
MNTLVEAASNSGTDLYLAEQVAAKLVAAAGGGVISNSWQGSEYPGELNDEKTFFSHPNVVYFASSGDSGFAIPVFRRFSRMWSVPAARRSIGTRMGISPQKHIGFLAAAV